MTASPDSGILLVDDDPAGAELTAAALAAVVPRVRIDIVGDGEEALAYLEAHAAGPPRAIVLDLKMPKLDGHEVLRQVRARAELARVRIIVLTSSDRAVDRRHSQELGCDLHLVKPVELSELIRQFEACAGRLFSP